MKIAVIGGDGYWGKKLCRVVNEIGHIAVSCDLKNGRNWKKLKIDAAIVSTPPQTHYSIAKDLLERDIPTLVEKPLAMIYDHAIELCEIAEKKSLCLMVDHTYLYTSAIEFIKKNLTDFGKIFYVDMTRINFGLFQRSGVIWDLAPHDLAILLYLFEGVRVKVVYGSRRSFKFGPDECAYLFIEFENGVMASLHLSWLSPVKIRRVFISAEVNAIIYDDGEENFKIQVYDNNVLRGSDQMYYRQGDVIIPYLKRIEPLAAMLEHFVSCSLYGELPISHGRQGAEVVRIIDALQTSAAMNGRRIVL